MLKENGCISEEVILMYDLQKSQEYVVGNLVVADEQRNVYRGIVSFMIIGLKSSVHPNTIGFFIQRQFRRREENEI